MNQPWNDRFFEANLSYAIYMAYIGIGFLISYVYQSSIYWLIFSAFGIMSVILLIWMLYCYKSGSAKKYTLFIMVVYFMISLKSLWNASYLYLKMNIIYSVIHKAVCLMLLISPVLFFCILFLIAKPLFLKIFKIISIGIFGFLGVYIIYYYIITGIRNPRGIPMGFALFSGVFSFCGLAELIKLKTKNKNTGDG